MTAGQATRGAENAVRWLETHQVALYLAALAAGALAGAVLPALAAPVERLIAPALVLLLYATFLGVPFARLGAAARDRRFTSGLLPNDTFAARMSAGGMMSAGFSRLRAGMRGVEIERDRDSTGKDDVRGGLRMPALIN